MEKAHPYIRNKIKHYLHVTNLYKIVTYIKIKSKTQKVKNLCSVVMCKRCLILLLRYHLNLDHPNLIVHRSCTFLLMIVKDCMS